MKRTAKGAMRHALNSKLLSRWRRGPHPSRAVDAELEAARARLGRRQHLLARFLAEPAFENDVRRDPISMARRFGAPESYTQWLAALAPERVAAFRRTQHMKRSVGGSE